MADQLLEQVTSAAIDPAMALLPTTMDSPAARIAMLTIGLQESKLCDRCQILPGGGRGPAHSLWQMERAGGVVGVLTHRASRLAAAKVCDMRGVAADSQAVWSAIEHDDILAAAFARLLIFTDAMALPAPDDVQGAWRMYALRLWRPGKPKPETWAQHHARARAFVLGLA
jgi:hypothetical protein